MSISRRRVLELSLSSLSLAATAATGLAQSARPIRIIVPYPPGGNTDIIGRLFADRLSARLGTTMIIDNRGGAGGALGAEQAAKAAPDGTTLVHATNNEMAVLPVVKTASPYDPVKDFAPISTTSKFPFVLVARKGLPVKSLSDLVALAKGKPDKLTCASVGVGTANQLVFEAMSARLKIDMTYVPYKGSGPVTNDIIGDHVDLALATVSSVLPYIMAGNVTALLVAGAQRMPQLPDVPSAGELGFRDLEAENWTAFFAPAGTDPALVQRLSKAVEEVGRDPDLQDVVRKAGAAPVTSTSDELSALLKSDLSRWKEIATTRGIKAE